MLMLGVCLVQPCPSAGRRLLLKFSFVSTTTNSMKCLVNWIPLNVHVRFEQNPTLILQAYLNPPFFVFWFSSSDGSGTFYYTSKLSKYFKRSKENHFWSKIPVIIAPNFEIGVKHYVHCVFVIYQWTRCGKFHHVRPHGFERPARNRFSSRPSFAGLFRALQAPCGVASIS